jgi:cobalt-zinc-cadmium efflux system outer membrane protein
MFYYKAVETRAAARAAWDHLQIARQRALYSRDVALPTQHRILNATQLEYNAMQVGVFQLLLAKKEEIEAGKNYIENLRDYWLARAEMESLLAGHVTATGLETTALDSVMGSALH